MRAGLGREQTLHERDSPTEERFKDSPSVDSLETDIANDSGSDTNHDDRHATRDKRKPTVVSAGTRRDDKAPGGSDNVDVTVVSQSDGTLRPDGSYAPAPDPVKSHFEIVDESAVDQSLFSGSDSDAANSSMQQALTLVMIALVIACSIGLFIYSTRVPSAENLYATIQQAYEDGDSTKTQNLIDQFSTLYPGDGRVNDISNSLAMERVVKRLRFESKGLTPPIPSEQKLLDALELRDTDPASASEQLRRWVNVYGDEHLYLESGGTGPTLAELANWEIGRLAGRSPKVKLAPTLQATLDQIVASNDGDAEKLQRLKDFMEIHSENEQARSAAKKRIDEIEEFTAAEKTD